MKLFLKKLHRYLLLFNMGFFFFLLWPPLYYYSLKPERYAGMIRLRRVWAYLSTLFSGIIFKFEFEELIDWSKSYIICPFHSSNLDTSMVSILLKENNCCFMGKDDLLDGMVTGIFFRTVDIPVNRESKVSGYRAFKRAAANLAGGINMIMFPEGGIADEYPPVVQEFKNGPFRLAIEQCVPVIPVSSLNTWEIMWDDGVRYGSRPGVCRIFVHKPVMTHHLHISETDALRDEVHHIISSKINGCDQPASVIDR